ncbi:MAG: nucleotide exchange factor GrpE [Streptosporangiaceae bacterium]|jgi:molecular chaperone GrpE (heat shock protein)
MAAELQSTEDLEPSRAAAADPDLEGGEPPPAEAVPESAGQPAATAETAPAETDAVPTETETAEAGPSPETQLAEFAAIVREVAELSQRYHARAEQREGVIDFLRSELDALRQGERRGVLRPMLAELCRLREDLLGQADTLPGDFDAAKAAGLLRSYAETLELTLENNGVVTYAPDSGDLFDPRLHRRAGGEPTADPALAGHVARVRRDGYLDMEANSPIAPAEVTVFTAVKPSQPLIGEPAPCGPADAVTQATEGER